MMDGGIPWEVTPTILIVPCASCGELVDPKKYRNHPSDPSEWLCDGCMNIVQKLREEGRL